MNKRKAFMCGFFDPVSKKWTHRVFATTERAADYLHAADEIVGPLSAYQVKHPSKVRVPKAWTLPQKVDRGTVG